MCEKTLVHKANIKWERKYNKLKNKYDKLACHVIVNKMLPNAITYSGKAVRVDISVTLYPDNAENKLTYNEFIKDITSERIKNEFMKLYTLKK